MSSRLFAAVGILLALGFGLGWLWLHPSATEATAGSYHLLVTGPAGEQVFNGTVADGNGTALSLLQQAGRTAGFAVVVAGAGGYSNGCDALYVQSVAGHGASGASGWVYAVRKGASGQWTYPARSAACTGLSEGDEVWWRWTDQPVKET